MDRKDVFVEPRHKFWGGVKNKEPQKYGIEWVL